MTSQVENQNMFNKTIDRINKRIKVREVKENYIHRHITQIPWDMTPNFNRHGFYCSVKGQCDRICGDTVFGNKRGLAFRGMKSVSVFLKKAADMDIFKGIPTGDVIIHPPTRDELVVKLIKLCERAIPFYSKYPQTFVTDMWAKRARVQDGSPLNRSIHTQRIVMDSSGKRFKGEDISVEKQVIDLIKSSSGVLAEGHVIAFLNTVMKCPTCKSIGNIGWCDGVSHHSVDAFRDAVCMNCRDNGVITLFEIKTRWEKTLHGNGTYGGNFTALNTLMTMKANVYLVIASRDTGNVRIGKITSATMRGNRNWLYSLQEDLGWGSPSSFVVCDGGLYKLPVTMPIIRKTMSNGYCDSIFEEVLNIVGLTE